MTVRGYSGSSAMICLAVRRRLSRAATLSVCWATIARAWWSSARVLSRSLASSLIGRMSGVLLRMAISASRDHLWPGLNRCAANWRHRAATVPRRSRKIRSTETTTRKAIRSFRHAWDGVRNMDVPDSAVGHEATGPDDSGWEVGDCGEWPRTAAWPSPL